MDIYDFKNMGHSGFEWCRIMDVESYVRFHCECDEGLLWEGDLDDAPECLDCLEITSIDVWYDEKAGRIEATIDVDGADADTYAELGLRYPEGPDGTYLYAVRHVNTGVVDAWCDTRAEAEEFVEADGGEHNYEVVAVERDPSPKLATDDLEPGQWLE